MFSLKNNEKLLLSLIKDDLVYTKFMHSLCTMGLCPDAYALQLSTTIPQLLGIEYNTTNEYIYDTYEQLALQIITIDIKETPDLLNDLANDLYTYLLKVKFQNV